MELITSGLGVLMGMMVWTFMVKKTALDHTRDKLFDARDDLRTTFIDNGWDLSSPVYATLRDLTNGYLNFTERFSVWHFLITASKIRNSAEIQKHSLDRLESEFAELDSSQKEFVKAFRTRTLHAVMDYSVYSSGAMVSISVLAAPILVLLKLLMLAKEGSGAALIGLRDASSDVGRTFGNLIRTTTEVVANLFVSPEILEEYSYIQGKRSAARVARPRAHSVQH